MSDHETKFDKWNAAYNEHGKRLWRTGTRPIMSL